jgi:cob(I)alamin adenosyltransferase
VSEVKFGKPTLSMAIYTRTGDRGKTRLGSGQKVSKDSCNVESYGTIDELNSLLGVIYSEISAGKKSYRKRLLSLLLKIQSDMFCIGAYLANPKLVDMIGHFEERIKKFEQEIDFMMGKAPPLTNFVFPQGGRVGSLFQLARTVSRRAERNIVTLAKKERTDSRILMYINRLSDLLLAAARYANHIEKKKEIIWSRDRYIK